MRSKDILIDGFEEIKILCQYLYMSEEHFIVVENPFTKLKISMTEEGYFLSQNMSFPDLPPMKYDMTILNLIACISQLKEQKPSLDYGDFKSKWDEVKRVCMANVALNEFNRR